MCGIAGILRLTPRGDGTDAALQRTPLDAIPEGWMDVLDESIRHRGPDGQGRFRDRAVRADGTVVDVALVHRRLSIIDHGGGAQPMVSQRGSGGSPGQPAGHAFRPLLFLGKPSDEVRYEPLRDAADTLAVVFNGCIYNHRELRGQLRAAGHEFATDHSDTEVLLHGWREWGAGVPDENDGMPLRTGGLADRLDDMFAFAVWDRRRATVALARDQYGQKPLYACEMRHDGAVVMAFGSAVPGLLRLREALGNRTACADEGVVRWLRFGGDGSLPVADLQEAPPSTIALADGPGWAYDAYLHLRTRERMTGVLSDAAVVFPRTGPLGQGEAEGLLRASVAARLEADVAVGCYLSGGVDSSLVAAFAKETAPEIETFTVKMPDPALDESAYAEEVARSLGLRHRTLPCVTSPASDLSDLITGLGLPFGDSSLLPTHWLAREVRRQTPVALCGDGGDEMFGGYERYRGAAALRAWPMLAMWPLGPDAKPASRRTRLNRLADAARHDRYRDLRSIFPRSTLTTLTSRARAAAAFEIETRFGIRPVGADAAIAEDIATYLPDDLMRKSDTASMRVALEVRSPFLDPALSAAARSASISSLMPRGQRKGLLRAIARRYLPGPIVDRPKMGFAIPIGDWFRSDYGGLRALLLDHMNSVEPFGPPSLGIDLNMAYVRKMLDEHLGTGQSGLVKRDHSQRLYMLLVLSVWAKWVGSLRG